MRHLIRLVPIVVVFAAVAGCGTTAGSVIAEGPRADGPPPYDGPLSVEIDAPDDPDVVTRAGAAGKALECDGDPANGSTGENYGLSSEAEDSAAGALATFLREDAYGLPAKGYRVEKSDSERVLMSFDVSGRTRVAVVVHLDGDKWQVETFAHCDPSEFPEDVDLPFDVWTDAEGKRAATTVVTSYRGAEHCGWQSVTFFTLKGTPGYVSDREGVLGELVSGYQPDTALPPDAQDTGYRLHDTELWLARDSSAAYLVTESGTERLAVLPEAFGCD